MNTFEFAYENQYPAGAPALSVYKPLTITFDLTSSSPALFTALARGTVFRDASIKKFEGDRLVGGWLLSSVVIQSDNTSSVGSQTTKSLTLTYANLTLVAGTETKLTTSSSSTTYGQSLTFTAVVTSTGVAVTSGSVAFSIGSTQLALVPVNSSGRASFTTTTLNVSGSPYTIDAVYLPSATLLASSASVGVSVSAATLTIYPSDNQSKVYGDALPALSFIATGLVNNDASTLVTGSLGTTATASSAVGSYPFTLGTLSAGSNYVLALANPAPQFTVSAALLTILPDENQSKIYGDNNPALTYTASGLKNNDPISVLSGALATTATTSSSVGSYPFALGTLTAGSNYSLVLANNAPTFTVKAASLTITPDAGQSKSYGSAVPTLSFTASGLKNNDAASIVVGQLGTTATASSSVGSYPFTLGSLAAGNNYVLALSSSAPQFTVNAATLTILPDANQSKIYGDSNPSLTFTSSGLVNNDPASIVIGQLGTTATSSSVVGSYPFTLGSLSAGSNYVLALSSSAPQFTVNAATLTILPDANQSKIYGDNNPTLTFTSSGLKNNDAASVLVGQLGTTATSSSAVGSYPFTLGSLSAGSNYVLALSSSAPQFAVNAATLTILPDANQSKIYGNNNPALTFTASGLKNNDAASIVVGQLGTTATSSSAVGSYPFTLGSLAAGNNYVLALSGSAPQFVVNAATLTILPDANQSKIYGDSNPPLTFTASGLKNNDSASIIVGALATTATVGSGVGTYAFGLGTLSAGSNYILELAGNAPRFEVKTATLTITPGTDQSKVYGSPVPTLRYSVAGLKNNDASSIVVGQLGTTATASSSVGEYAFTLNTLTAGANYSVALNPASSKFKVTPAPLRITADDKTKSYGADNPPLTATISGLVNGDTPSVVSGLVLTTTATKFSPPAATPYPITASGARASNYQIQFVAGKLTVNGLSLVARGTAFTPTAGAPFQGRVASFTNPDPGSTVNSYTALIAWGDGSTSNGTIIQSGNEFVVIGSRTYSTAGNYSLRITIRHRLGITTPTDVSSMAVVTRLGFGQTQNTDYWRDQAGQSLINSFNESASSTQLGNWLATTFPRLYGTQAGSNNNLTGRTNTQVAAYYVSLFRQSSNALEREVLATALNIYASTLNLGGVAGARAGFQVTLEGLGATSVNVGLRGGSFGVPNNSSLTVLSLLTFINSRTTSGVLYSGTPALRAGAQQVLSDVNQRGKIGIDEDQVESASFWSSWRGQGLIRSFNGGSTATQLSSWLAETMPNLFGATAGARNLTGRTNAQVAQAFSLIADSKRDRAYAQVFALALNVYATTQSLGGSSGQNFFKITAVGLGAAEFNIGSNGAVAGVANGSTINVYSYLRSVDRFAVGGVLYNGNSRLTELAEDFTKRLND